MVDVIPVLLWLTAQNSLSAVLRFSPSFLCSRPSLVGSNFEFATSWSSFVNWSIACVTSWSHLQAPPVLKQNEKIFPLFHFACETVWRRRRRRQATGIYSKRKCYLMTPSGFWRGWSLSKVESSKARSVYCGNISPKGLSTRRFTPWMPHWDGHPKQNCGGQSVYSTPILED